MLRCVQCGISISSLPLWERGLKFVQSGARLLIIAVAPLVGAWIEIAYNRCVSTLERVAPLVGAWIEIACCAAFCSADSGRRYVG